MGCERTSPTLAKLRSCELAAAQRSIPYRLDFLNYCWTSSAKEACMDQAIPSEQGYSGQRPASAGLEVVQVPEWSGAAPIGDIHVHLEIQQTGNCRQSERSGSITL